MKRTASLVIAVCLVLNAALLAQSSPKGAAIAVPLQQSSTSSSSPDLRLFGFSYDTASGSVSLPGSLTDNWQAGVSFKAQAQTADHRTIELKSERDGANYTLKLTAQPSTGIIRWSFSTDCSAPEYFTGLMERLVDGPQQETWRPGRTEALNLRGQSVDMLVKPTLSIYAPFYVSSRGYGVFVKGTWPGHIDFCAKNSDRVDIEFEGPSLALKIYTAKNSRCHRSRPCNGRRPARPAAEVDVLALALAG